MKPCEQCKQDTSVLVQTLQAENEDSDFKEVWVCPECFILQQGEEQFNTFMRAHDLYFERTLIQ